MAATIACDLIGSHVIHLMEQSPTMRQGEKLKERRTDCLLYSMLRQTRYQER